MRRSREIQGRVDLIRQASTHPETRRPLVGNALVEAGLWLEQAGLPAAYRLPFSAREYFHWTRDLDLALVLAERVGNPRIAPVPSLWPFLALLLLRPSAGLSPDSLIRRAGEHGIRKDVELGVAIVAHLFPELDNWAIGAVSGIPRLEKTFAVPLAARKLVLVEESE